MFKTKLVRLLKQLSLGKYRTKLYYGDKKGQYSTVTGGIITLFFAVLFIAASIYIMIQSFKRDNYTLNA
jgi:hypothetical protein